MKLDDIFEAGPAIDNVYGMGAVGISGNINYMGLRVYVKPSVFLKLAYSHPNLDTTYIQQQLSLGKAIGAPFLSIEIPDSWISPDSHYDQVKEGDLTEPARITGHEGRHRMAAIMKEYGDVPIETHLLFNGLRRRHITDNMVERLNADILNEHGKILIGPWFSLTETITEGLSHTDPVETWIRVFKNSTHPKFKGKSMSDRERMARMAQYRAVQNKDKYASAKNTVKETVDIDFIDRNFLKDIKNYSIIIALGNIANRVDRDKRFNRDFSANIDTLENHKSLIITELLKFMKTSEVNEEFDAVLAGIKYINSVGINWPELTVIKKSCMVHTNNKLNEKWSKKYKDSINCSNPKGFSQKAHCAGKQKHESVDEPCCDKCAEHGTTCSSHADSVVEETKRVPSAEYLKLASALEDYANKHIPKSQQGFGDFMYHAELIRKGHQDVHKQDLDTIQQCYRKTMSDIIKQHLKENVADNNSNDLDSDLLDDALFMLKHRINDGLKFMIKYGITLKDLSAAEYIIDKKKSVIVKDILKKIKTITLQDWAEGKRNTEWNALRDYINELIELGISWPEIKTIHHSMQTSNFVNENFADGKGPGKPGDSARHGIPKHATLAQLDSIGNGSGRKAQLARWQANMRRGRAKVNETDPSSYMPSDNDDDDDFDPCTEIRPQAIEDIVAAVPQAREIWFHGSRATGDWDEESDWDILVVVPDSIVGTTYIDIAEWLQNVARKYPGYDIQPAHPRNMITRIAREEGTLLWSHKPPVTEAIAPHGDPNNELKMMKAGTKPAALIGPMEFEHMYKPLIDDYGWEVVTFNNNRGRRYVVGQMGEYARIKRIADLVDDMNKNMDRGIRATPEYHIQLGRLLGYSEQDIKDFLKKIANNS